MTIPNKKPPAGGHVQIQVPANLEPVYANFALITNSPSEIIVDFAQILPQFPQARVKTRVIMTPINAKLLLRALSDHLSRFETQYGEIIVPEGSSLATQLFRSSSAPKDPPEE